VTEISDQKNRLLSITESVIEKIGHYQWSNQWPKKSVKIRSQIRSQNPSQIRL